MDKTISRRSLLIKGGTLAVAGVAATAGGLGIINPADAAKKKGGYPYQYKKMNPQKCAEIAYSNWYKNFCGYGALA